MNALARARLIRALDCFLIHMERKFRIILVLSFILPLIYIILGFTRSGEMRSLGDVVMITLPFLLPYALFSFSVWDSYIPFVILALIQFPIYVVVWYQVKRRTRFPAPGWILLGIHLVVAVWAFITWAERYSK